MQPHDIIHFWFEEIDSKSWFAKDDDFDQKIIDRFKDIFHKAKAGELDHWQDSPQGALALVIILDQFPRNMFRDSALSFATDKKAINISKQAIKKGFDQKLTLGSHRHFLYMPFMHSEKLADQEEAVKLFKALGNEIALDYAIQHYEIIKRFGRFPHRNKAIGRQSTKEEQEFLKQPGSSF